jgi:AmmeMemoRadiSam system protein A
MSSPDTATGLRASGETLIEVAWSSIRHGITAGQPLEPDPAEFPPPLREQRASFVTLRRGGTLRGCTGGLEARLPLVQDVAYHAFCSALHDPRFPPLAGDEIEGLDLEISVLSPLEPLAFDSEQALLAQLRPHVDGLVLRERDCMGTFLPSVWQSLPDPPAFLRELKRKAGLPADHWSASLEALRYTVESIAAR